MFQASLGVSDAFAFVLIVLAAIAFVAAFRFLRRTTPISKVHQRPHLHLHPAKNCKFDEEEVRRTRHLATPPIDTSNLPPADARIVAAMAQITKADVEQMLREFSGEVDTVVRGQTVRIRSRNTFGGDIIHAHNKIFDWYKALGFEVELQSYKYRGKTLYNVIAKKKGSKTPDKWLLLGAHTDSTAGDTGRAEPVAPGADDDGSGTVGLLLMAKRIAELDLGVSVMFCHFSGEEQGLWGSAVHADKVAAEKLQIVGQLQFDMIGYCNKPGNRLDIHDDVDRNGSHSLVVAAVRAAKRYALNLKVVDTHNRAVTGRSDHASYQNHGYKAVLFSEEFSDDGFNPNYHSTGDRVASCNLDFMVEVIKLGIACIADLGDLR
ncbi:MAG: M28 family peptidase [Candidatus Obscuribacterales bacterium]|jgi:hypothetical protein